MDTNSLDPGAVTGYVRPMSHRAPGERMSYAEYVAREAVADVKHEFIRGELATYSDVTVVCDQAETLPDDPQAVVNPTVVVEVLSDSTEAYDRGAKAASYRRIPSLRAYVLVSQREPAIELFRRTDAGAWELVEARRGSRLELRSLVVTLDVDAVYRDPLG